MVMSQIQHPIHFYYNVPQVFGPDWVWNGYTLCPTATPVMYVSSSMIRHGWQHHGGDNYGTDSWSTITKQYVFSNSVSYIQVTGILEGTDVPGGRYTDIIVDSVTVKRVMYSDPTNSYKDMPFSVGVSFTPSKTPLVVILQRQNPAWSCFCEQIFTVAIW